jgi:plasmid stabilization system protein ParE
MSSIDLRLLEDAEEEANDAFDWYQSQSHGLGDEFRIEVKLALKRIASAPLQYAVVLGSNIRRVRLHRFPYSIIYEFQDASIVVIAIFNENRNPIIWRGRID